MDGSSRAEGRFTSVLHKPFRLYFLVKNSTGTQAGTGIGIRSSEIIPITTPSSQDSIESGSVTQSPRQSTSTPLLLSAYPSAAKHLIYRRPQTSIASLTTPTPAHATDPHVHFSRQATRRDCVPRSSFSPYSPRLWWHTGPENKHPRCDVRSGTSAACNTLPKNSPRQR